MTTIFTGSGLSGSPEKKKGLANFAQGLRAPKDKEADGGVNGKREKEKVWDAVPPGVSVAAVNGRPTSMTATPMARNARPMTAPSSSGMGTGFGMSMGLGKAGDMPLPPIPTPPIDIQKQQKRFTRGPIVGYVNADGNPVVFVEEPGKSVDVRVGATTIPTPQVQAPIIGNNVSHGSTSTSGGGGGGQRVMFVDNATNSDSSPGLTFKRATRKLSLTAPSFRLGKREKEKEKEKERKPVPVNFGWF